MRIDTTIITDENKKNELILFANNLGGKAVYNPKTRGMDIEVDNPEKVRKINQKIEELKN